MASTVTLQDVIRWASTHIKLQPITGVGGFQQEPALSICNDVLQTILSAPFNWKFNRREISLDTTAVEGYVQDYDLTATDIGWLEGASRVRLNTSQLPPPTYDIEVEQDLRATDAVGEPEQVSFFNETDAGARIRLNPIPAPEVPYRIDLVYQGKAPIKYGVQETWAPIPDELGYVYRQGFLASAYRAVDDPRADREYLKFIEMIRKAVGLKDMESTSATMYPAGGLFLG